MMNPLYNLEVVAEADNHYAVLHVLQSRRPPQDIIIRSILRAAEHRKDKNINVLLRHVKCDCDVVMAAIDRGDTDILKFIQTAGLDTSCTSAAGDSMFTHAVLSGHRNMMEHFIRSCHDINTLDRSGETCMTKLCAQPINVASRFAFLIDNGADIHTRNSQNLTPLMCAAYCGTTRTVHLLLTHGAVVNHSDHNSNTALLFSAMAGNYDTFVLLAKHAHDIVQVNGEKNTALMLLLTHQPPWSSPTPAEFTTFLAELCRHRALVNTPNYLNNTPLLTAIKSSSDNVIDMILAQSTPPCIRQTTWSGLSVFILAFERHKFDLCQRLLDVGSLRSAQYTDVDSVWWSETDLVNRVISVLDIATSPSYDLCERANELFFGSGECVPHAKLLAVHPVACRYFGDNTLASLKHCCRNAIRRELCHVSTVNLLWLINTLPLPTLLKDYLALKH